MRRPSGWDSLTIALVALLALLAGPAPARGTLAQSSPAAAAAITCQPRGSITVGVPVDGVLGAGGCTLSQLIAGAHASPAEQYTLTLTDRGRLTLSAPRLNFSPYVVLLDDRYRVLSESLSSGTAVVDVVVPPGIYVVAVAAVAGEPGGGAYRVNSVFAPQPAPAGCGTAGIPLAPGGLVAGSLGPSDCRHFDAQPGVFRDPFVKRYDLDLPKPGALSLDLASDVFDPVLVLLDVDQNAVASDRAALHPGAGRASLNLHLPAGRYVVLAGAEDSATGDYRLSSTFLPAADSTPVTIGPDVPAQGRLEPTDCRVAYLADGDYDQSPADLFRIVIPQHGATVLNVAGTGFSPVLRAWDADGDEAIAPVRDEAGTGLLTRGVRFNPGSYTVAISAMEGAAATGDYSLRFSFVPLAEPCVARALSPGTMADGDLALTDCTLDDMGVEDGSAAFAHQYRVTVSQRGVLSAVMTASDFDARLYGLSEAMGFVASQADPLTSNARIDFVVYPGTYVLVATSDALGLGHYQLTANFQAEAPPADCPIARIQPDATVNAALTASACRGIDVVRRYGIQEYTDRYRVTLTERGQLTVTMASDSVDSFLDFFDAKTYALIDFVDDYRSDSLDAQIVRLLPPGDYLIHASTAVPGTGDYRLSLDFEPKPNACPMGLLGLDTVQNGQLTEADCTEMDTPIGGYRTQPLDIYRLHVPQFSRLTVEHHATEFDARLGLFDGRWERQGGNDDRSADTTDARLDQLVAPGFYLLAAMTSDGAGGAYELRTTFEPAAMGALPTPTPQATPVSGGRGTLFLPLTVRAYDRRLR